MLRQIFWTGLLFLCFSMYQIEARVLCSIDFSGSWAGALQSFYSIDKDDTFSSISIRTDPPLLSYEYDYLCGLCREEKNAKRVSWFDVKDVLERCYYAHVFSSVELVCKNGEELQIVAQRSWKFRRVRLHGPLISRERYRRFYALEPGDVFNEEKHKASIESVVGYLKDIGFLDAIVHDVVTRCQDDHTVAVDLTMHPGKRFHVSSVALSYQGSAAEGIDATVKKKLETIVKQEIQGEFFTQDAVAKVLRSVERCLGKCGFWDVRLDSNYERLKKGFGVSLQISCTINKVRRFVFVGNSFFSKKQLYGFLDTFGSALHLIPARVLEQEIVEHYRERGFWRAAVSLSSEGSDNVLKFCIDEGPRARLCEIIIQGTSHLDVVTLKKQFFSACMRQRYYDALSVKQALDECAQFYVMQGFWDVALTHECCVSSDGSECTLVVRVTEGEQRFLNKMDISVPCDDEWLACIESFDAWRDNFCLGVPFSPQYVQQCFLWFRSYFRESGLRARVRPHFVGDSNIDVTWDVSGSAQPCRFGQTVFSGCGVLDKNIIMRELDYCRGDVWDRRKLAATCDRLRSLGIFDRVVVYPAPREAYEDELDDDSNEQTVIVKFRQADKYQIRPRVGFQTIGKWGSMTGGSLRGGGSLVCRNPFQRGGIVRLDAQVTRFRRDISARYRIPWLFGFPIRAEFLGYSVRYDQFVTPRSKRVLYKAHRDGIAINLGTGGLCKRQNMSFGCEMSGISSLAPDLGQLLCFDPMLLNKKRLFFYSEPMYVLDARDNPVSPNSGSFTLLTAKAMVPVDNIKESFVRFLGVQALYFPIHKSVVAMRFRVGHIFNKDFCCIEPPDRYYLGGSYSLRGYDMDMAPPLRCFTDGKCNCCVPFGGRSMLNANIELRLPLPWNLRGVLFTDMGYLSENAFADIKPHSVIGATGFGFRYATPIGMLRFDIGWKWKPDAWSQSRCAWFLTIGDMF